MNRISHLVIFCLLVGCTSKVERHLNGVRLGGGAIFPTPTPGPFSSPDPGPSPLPTPGVSPTPNPSPGVSPTPIPTNFPTEANVLDAFPQGAASFAAMCATAGNDRVRRAFCVQNPPVINSIAALQNALTINPNNNPTLFALTGHSSSLVARFTSAINPRAVIFTPQGTNDYTIMGFVRGEQFVELIAKDPAKADPDFFLLKFNQACNARVGGCNVGELLTPAVESNWTSVSIFTEEQLKNTVLDCRQCHQSTGPGTPKILRMQEQRDPWTHWFRDNRTGGQALLADYTAAHGTQERYANIAGNNISNSDPRDLEDLLRSAGFRNLQANEFQTQNIEDQVEASSPAQPQNNNTPGVSAIWQTLYDRAVAGLFIPVPYHDVKVSDSQKLATMTQAYVGFRNGTVPVDQLPDIRNVFRDDRLHEMGFAVKPGQTGAQILVNACMQCHNNTLDQTISRARFNAQNLAGNSRAEKDLAIARLTLPEHHLAKMPPERFKKLTPAEIQLAVEELRR